MSMQYIIGIDAGGTKTTAAAFDLNGTKIAEEKGAFGNVTVDFDAGVSHICETVGLLMERVDGECIYLCLGCAGIETGGHKERAAAIFKERYPFPCFLTNDAMLGLYAALCGQDGILIIAGTGSIGYLKKDGALHRFGGWGHLINDDGSGYTIALKAIRFIAYSFDTNASETMLKKAVFAKLQITELRELIDFTYRSSKGEIAALVPAIEDCADKGDLQAQEILRWAGERLSMLAVGLCRQYEVSKPLVAVSGSILQKIPLVQKTFCTSLAREIGGYTLTADPFDPTKGGYYIWQEKTKQG